jgi:hypothetical protein
MSELSRIAAFEDLSHEHIADPDELQQPLPRNGRCRTCSGSIERIENPKPGVEWAEMCISCAKWYRWKLTGAAEVYDAQPDAG